MIRNESEGMEISLSKTCKIEILRGIFWENQSFELFFWQSDWGCTLPTLQMTNRVSPNTIWVCWFRIWRPLMNPTLRFFWKLKWKKSFFQKQNGWESHTMQLLFEVSFFENRQKSLSPAAKSFLRVVWSYNWYQKIPWTLRNIFHMHNMLSKSIERNLRAKNEASCNF